MEFQIITDLSILPSEIETNAEELKLWLAERCKKYNALVVTPESVRAAKDDKAALNKLRAALEERRKEIKRKCMAPYEEFERKYKELIALIDEPITAIDTQIKALDEQEQQEKYRKIQEHFVNITRGLAFEIVLDKILDPKWKNKTNPLEKICDALTKQVMEIIKNRREIEQFYHGSPHYTAIMNCFAENYKAEIAYAYAASLVQQEEAQAQRAAEKAARLPQQMPAPAAPPQQNEPQITGTFRVTGTKSQIISLRDFMRENGIKFEIVKEK